MQIISSSNRPIRMIVADDHAIFIEGMYTIFRKQKNVQIVATASNGKELIEKVSNHHPDIVLTDIRMPVMDGIEATKRLVQQFPNIPIVAITMLDCEQDILEMLGAGAKGYLVKNVHKEHLFEAVQNVSRGDIYYCSTTSNQLLKGMVNMKIAPQKTSKKIEFTERELQVIHLICQEFSSKQIAAQIDTEPKSVERTKERIFEKIGTHSSVGIVLYAVRNNLVSLD